MGYLSCVDSQNRPSLPHTPPDFVSSGCSPSPYLPSRYNSLGPSPHEHSWPRPKAPISPPMSSHDHPPPPPSPSAKLPSPGRPSSSSGGMSMAATAPTQHLATTTPSSAASAARVTAISAITEAPADLERGQRTTETSQIRSPQKTPDQQALGLRTADDAFLRRNVPVLPPLSSLFAGPEPIRRLNPSPLERPASAMPAPAGHASHQPSSEATSSQSLPQPLPLQSTYTGPAAAEERPQERAANAYQRPYHQSQQIQPSAQARDRHDFASSYQRETPFTHAHMNKRSQPNAIYPLSPQEHRFDREQQQSQHDGPQAPQAPRPWSDSRPSYDAASKWSACQDERSIERSGYDGQKQYQHQGQDSQRYQSVSASRDEYFRRYLSSQAAPNHPQQQLPATGAQDSRPSPLTLSGPSMSLPGSMPSTPASAGFSEGGPPGPPKEGMGPKIWTGVDFLPQFMHASEVDGEGMCYFYDDGSHCKAVIDGEPVNPYWGVTKAGKPRKRLAIACMTCREKKIKCDPEYPRCVQCEKFGRVCKFKNAPRGGNNTSPGAISSEPDTQRKVGLSYMRQLQESPRSMAYGGPYSDPSRGGRTRPLSPGTVAAANAGNKRARTDYDHYTTAGERRSPPYYGAPPPPPPVEAPRGGSVLPPLSWGKAQPPPHFSQPQTYTHSPHHQARPGPPPPPPPSYTHHSSYSPQYLPPPPPPPPSSAQHHYPPQSYADQPRSHPVSPSQQELPRIVLPPPRSAPDMPRARDDAMRRPWQSDLRPHGRA